jgi:hypothetical protein
MSEISVIGNAVVGKVPADAPTAPKEPVEVAAPAVERGLVEDHVDFSQKAQMLEKIQQLPNVRQHRIDAIKDAIATDTYLTADKLDLAINRMIDEVVE